MDFNNIFQDNYKYIYTYALKLTGHITDAEDLTQEVFLTAFSKMDQLKDKDLLKYWLRKICLNSFLMDKRKKQLQLSAQGSDTIELLGQVEKSSVDTNLIVEESLTHIQTVCFLTIINRMGQKQRLIFSMIDMFGMKVNEVSELLDMSVPAVKSHLNRGRKKLDEELSTKCGLLSVDNPCDCKAWEHFVLMRQERSNRLRNREIKYSQVDKEESLLKISDMLKEMQGFIPSEEWYEKVSADIKKIT